MSSRWAQDFRQAFAVATRAETDGRGEESFNEFTSYPCRFEPNDNLVRTPDGSQKVATGTIYTEAAVTVEDVIWPPGVTPGDVATSFKIISTKAEYDLETGLVDFYKIVF